VMARGRVQRGCVGMDVQPLHNHSKEQTSVLIGGVLKGSPADQGGLKPGDRLLRLGGTATNVRYDEQMPDFMRLVTGLPLGKETVAVIERAGKPLTVRLTPVQRGEHYLKRQDLKQ